MQYDSCPYKKRRFNHRHIQREDRMKTQGEDGHVQAKGRGHGRGQHGQHSDPEPLASRL